MFYWLFIITICVMFSAVCIVSVLHFCVGFLYCMFYWLFIITICVMYTNFRLQFFSA